MKNSSKQSSPNQNSSNQADTSTLQSALHRDIPITEKMGVEIIAVENDKVHVRAPLNPNSNHKGTAFGGSVHSVAVVSCWTLVSVTVSNAGLSTDYIVIQDSQMAYLEPVDTAFEAVANWPDEKSKIRFLESLKKKGLARATIHSRVSTADGRLCAELTARFVAQLKKA